MNKFESNDVYVTFPIIIKTLADNSKITLFPDNPELNADGSYSVRYVPKGRGWENE